MDAGPGSIFRGEARVRGGPARGKGTPQGLGGRAALPARRLRCSWPGGRGPEPRTRGALGCLCGERRRPPSCRAQDLVTAGERTQLGRRREGRGPGVGEGLRDLTGL